MIDLAWQAAAEEGAMALTAKLYGRFCIPLLGWHLSRLGKAKTAEMALEHTLITRWGPLGRVPMPFPLRSDNCLVFTSRSYTALVSSYGLKQGFITPHCLQQNRMVERVIRTLKEQYVHPHLFETLQHASRVLTTTGTHTKRWA